MQTLLYFPSQPPKELAETLEVLLHGYLHHAFQLGTSAEEAMAHFENVQPLIKALQNQITDDHSPNQTTAEYSHSFGTLRLNPRQQQSLALSLP